MRTKLLPLLLLMALFIGCNTSKKALTVSVHNPSSLDRVNEMAEIDWKNVLQKLPTASGKSIIVTNDNGVQIPFQLVSNGAETIQSLIFPVSVNAGQTAVYQVSLGEPEKFEPLVYGRLVPERKDDFTWENNRTAFRVYGPALKATGEISNGMDFWAKRTDALIIDKWYENDLAGVASYHRDHGEGLDFYKVGRTLGLGMTAPFDNDTLCLGDNFVTAEILDHGPLRVSFKLTYDPYPAGDHQIRETRFISLDAYQLFNRVTKVFETDAPELALATGIVMEQGKPEITYGVNHGIIAYETPGTEKDGTIYTAAINLTGYEIIKAADGHYLGVNSYKPGTPYTYYTGGGWSKAGFESFDAWTAFVNEQKEKIENTLSIQIK